MPTCKAPVSRFWPIVEFKVERLRSTHRISRRYPPGAYIEVTVSALADLNSVIPGSFFNGKMLTATATMMKEF